MNTFVLWLIQNPMFCVGFVVALVAAIGFLTFLRGFIYGMTHLISINGFDEHLGHARERITWGFVIMVNMFVTWVVLRAAVTLLGYDNANLPMSFNILIGYGILVFILYLKKIAFQKSEGGGH